MKSLTGKGNYQNYDGHFVPVVPKDPNKHHEVSYYPCKVGEKHVYTELVVFESAQVLPCYLIELQPELLASPPGMGAASASTFTASGLLDILFPLLDEPQIQQHPTLKPYLQSKVDMLLELSQSTPLEPEDVKLFKLAERLLTQEKVSNAVLNMILKTIPAPLSSSPTVSSLIPSSASSSTPVAPLSLPMVSNCITPALPSIAFGAAKWNQYFGDVGAEPPLPSNIDEILSSPCPFWPGKKVYQTHLLTLIPQTVNGKPRTLQSLEELVKTPKQGSPTQYIYFSIGQYIDLPAPASRWVLMTRNAIEGSRRKRYADQQALVASYAQKTGIPYEVPHVLDVAVSIFLEYVQSRTRLYHDYPMTYTRCQENWNEKWQLTIGKFTPAGLDIYYYYDHDSIGVGCSRKL